MIAGVRRWIPALAALLMAPASAYAQAPPALDVPAFGGFHSVLAQGEGQTVTATDLAAYELSGTAPSRFTDQQPLYDGVMPRASTLTEADIPTYYKDATFGSMPGGVESVTTPRPGVQIFRDKRYGMAHVYGQTRADVMFGAGYATAQERLFLMDALRRTAEGRLAGLTGPGSAGDDAAQLTDQDFSPAEYQKQFDALPKRFGAEGARGRQDIIDYVAGINQRIADVKADPSQMPAEYAALGTQPEAWTVPDSVALATLLVTQFTVSNGSEEVNAAMQQAFQKRFGKRWRAPYNDLREAEDPEALVVAKRPFASDRTGRRKRGLNAIPDPGSIKPRNPEVAGPDAAAQAAARAAQPAWVTRLSDLKSKIPHEESNAVMVAGSLSSDGKPLAAMGPQVSYYSPQIFSEYELHGGGIDVWGVTFPGSSPYPLIGHGIDFSWSGTSANGDNQDTFVEKLCEPGGSAPSRASTFYRYRGKCIPFVSRDQTLTTPFSPLDPTTPPTTVTYRTLRSVHGPVFATATVGGAPVALTKAKGVDFHELDALLPFMRLAEGRVRSAAQFRQAFSVFPGTENWFYADNRSVTFQQSGNYPRHARGSNVDLPFWGDGRADWQGFDPATYTFSKLPDRRRPTATDPRDGYIISWNNKEARGWRKGPREWDNGPVHRALILRDKLMAEKRRGRGKVDLAGLTRAVNTAATTDLRADAELPWLLRVIGRGNATEQPFLDLLKAWRASGGQRLDANGDNVYDHSAAVAIMDAWWPRLVRGMFEDDLGTELFTSVESNVLGLDGFGWSWASQVQKDLRAVLGKRVPGHSRRYCGRTRAACRAVLLKALDDAIAEQSAKRGPDPSQWKVPATCPQTQPASCDQIVPATAGAIDTPPFPWQNRGTYHQVVRVRQRR